jgi:hypothetical protein
VTVGGCQFLTYMQEHLIVAQFSLSLRWTPSLVVCGVGGALVRL